MRVPEILLCVFWACNYPAFCQYVKFQRADDVNIFHPDSRIYQFPWSGGFNYCQSGELDLNQDGIKDIVVFDRSGNRIIPLVYENTSNGGAYSHDFRYEQKFPEIREFLVLYDFNCDGLNDLFTYSDGGIRVFKNKSKPATGLQFELYAPQLNSGSISVFILPVDYPAVCDVDNDGDTDVLTFGFAGTCIEYHRNMAKELLNRCDTLMLRMESDNWGLFTEDFSSNSISLNDSCDKEAGRMEELRHAGSSLLAVDLDGDLDKDLLLGDISYPNLLALTNGGSIQKAIITASETSFPLQTRPVDLAQFPTASQVDYNHDGKSDLIVGANSKSNSENYRCTWLYENIGSNLRPEYHFVSDTLFTGNSPEVGQGSIPVAFDHNGDGLIDLVLGSEGRTHTSGLQSSLSLFENTGAGFQLVDLDYAGLGKLNLQSTYFHPCFLDLDSDGDSDMLVGRSDGRLMEFENTATPGSPAKFQLKNPFYNQIDVGTHSAPFAWDTDHDNLPELFIGNGAGKIAYYTSRFEAGMLQFNLINSSWGEIQVSEPDFPQGMARPCLFQKEENLYLVCGSASGKFHAFVVQDSQPIPVDVADWNGLYCGENSALCVLDIERDGLLEAITGNQAGGLCLFREGNPLQTKQNLVPPTHFQVFPNPGMANMRIIGKDTQAEPTMLCIFYTDGRLMQKLEFSSNQININTADWSPGLYFIHLQGNTHSSLIRWIRLP